MDAADYTKRKHVFKLLSRAPQHQSTSTIGHTEILVQAETDCQMNEWRDLLQSVCDPNSLLKKVRRDLDGIKLQRRKGISGVVNHSLEMTLRLSKNTERCPRWLINVQDRLISGKVSLR